MAEHAYLGALDGDHEREAQAMRERHTAEMAAMQARQRAALEELQGRRTPVHRRLMEVGDAPVRRRVPGTA